MDVYSFGEWLRRKRKGRDLTQEDLAQRVGCSTSNIRKIEAEERRPSAQIALLLARQFEIAEAEESAFLHFARGDWHAAPQERNPGFVRHGTSAAPRSKLPAPPNTIIGRQKELVLVCGSLVNPATRLLTLVGPPGIGKTRLGLEAAHAILEGFPDGVFFVALAPLDDPDRVAPIIQQTLGIVDVKGHTALERLKEGIGDKETLLVLDNAEHLIRESARLVTELIHDCPNLKILVTSREALRVPGEWLFPVPVLAFPSVSQITAAEPEFLSEFAAINLFMERARALRPDFVLNDENVGHVVAVCTRLDGLPLAIELIAPRLRLMSPQALLARMSDQFTLSADGQRAVPARQKTLQNAIAWSYDLLSDEERQLLARLAVFSGGFTSDAAEAAFATSVYPASVTDLIASLSDKSLLQRSFDSSGEVRFSMLVTIQQFAFLRLREAGEEPITRERHLAYLVELAAKAEGEIHGSEQVEWLNVLRNDQDNFRAALEWAISEEQTGVALHLLGAIGWSWFLRGSFNELLSWFERVRILPRTDAQIPLYAGVLDLVARSYEDLGDIQSFRSVYEEMRKIGLRLGSSGDAIVAHALTGLAIVEAEVALDHDKGQTLHEQALALFEKCGDTRGMARAMFGLCVVAYLRFDQDAAARSWGEKSLALYRQAGDSYGITLVIGMLALQSMREGNFDRARPYAEERLTLAKRLDTKHGIAYALCVLAQLHRYQRDFDRAVEVYEESLAVAREYGLTWSERIAHEGLGLIALQRSDYALARDHIVRCFHVGRSLAANFAAQHFFAGMAAVAAGLDEPVRAAALSGADQAMQLRIGHDSVFPQYRAVYNALLATARGQLSEAAFEAAAARGQAMSLDEAIAYALE